MIVTCVIMLFHARLKSRQDDALPTRVGPQASPADDGPFSQTTADALADIQITQPGVAVPGAGMDRLSSVSVASAPVDSTRVESEAEAAAAAAAEAEAAEAEAAEAEAAEAEAAVAAEAEAEVEEARPSLCEGADADDDDTTAAPVDSPAPAISRPVLCAHAARPGVAQEEVEADPESKQPSANALGKQPIAREPQSSQFKWLATLELQAETLEDVAVEIPDTSGSCDRTPIPPHMESGVSGMPGTPDSANGQGQPGYVSRLKTKHESRGDLLHRI